MVFKLLQCSELAAAMHVGPSYCLVTRITQFCQGGCNIYCRLWQANTGSCRCFRLFGIFQIIFCSTAAQGEAREVAPSGRAVMHASRPFSHAFCLDGHSPSQHRQQCGRSGSVWPGLWFWYCWIYAYTYISCIISHVHVHWWATTLKLLTGASPW